MTNTETATTAPRRVYVGGGAKVHNAYEVHGRTMLLCGSAAVRPSRQGVRTTQDPITCRKCLAES